MGYSFTPSSNLWVSDVLHCFGNKVSIWTTSGQLVASQTFALSGPGWVATPLAHPVQLQAGVTYVIADYSDGQNYGFWPNRSYTSALGTMGQDYYAAGDAFPTTSEGDDWWAVDIGAQVGDSTPVPISATTATFVNGVWSGNVTVPQTESGMYMQVDDGAGHVSASNIFNVVPVPLSETLPSNATKGEGTVNGTLNIAAALNTDLVVNLASSDTSRAAVPASLTIPAGQTSIPLPITIVDDGLLDGPETVTITATSASSLASGTTATIRVHDNETATLTMSLPSGAHETAGTITGTITASAAPAANFTLQLVSSDPTQLTVPATVVLPAGQTSVSFTATLLDNHVIEAGSTPVIVTASTENWTSGAATVNVIDDDRWMTVTLPATGWEGQTLAAQGTIRIGGTLASDLVVSLASSDATQLGVPATVTIPAGQTSATFNVTLLDNGLHTGPQSEQVTATAAGLPAASSSIVVKDADVDHFGFSTISTPQAVGLPFMVTITACDLLGNVIQVYNGEATLSATGSSGALPINLTTITFVAGKWTGQISVDAHNPSATLQANGAGETSASNTFAVQSAPLASFASSTIASPQTANVAFPLTLTAKDANGYTITDYEGTVNLNGWAVGSSSVTNVLLLDQSVNHYLATALSTLGLNYTLYLTDDNFRIRAGQRQPEQHLGDCRRAGHDELVRQRIELRQCGRANDFRGRQPQGATVACRHAGRYGGQQFHDSSAGLRLGRVVLLHRPDQPRRFCEVVLDR